MILKVLRRKVNEVTFEYDIIQGTVTGNLYVRGVDGRMANLSVRGNVAGTGVALDINKFYTSKDIVDGKTNKVSGHIESDECYVISECSENRSGVLTKLAYVECESDSKKYQVYEMGLGCDSVVFSIYSGDTLVGQVSRNDEAVESEYTIYSLDGASLGFLASLVVYMDLTRFSPNASNKSKAFRNTFNNEIRHKYNSRFIQMIKDLA